MSGMKKVGPAKRAPKSRRRSATSAIIEINDETLMGKERRRSMKWSRSVQM